MIMQTFNQLCFPFYSSHSTPYPGYFMKKSFLYIFVYLLIILLGFLFALEDQFAIINLMLLLVCLCAYFVEPLFIIFLAVIFLPTNGIYGTEYNLLGVLSPLTTTQLFAFLYLIQNYQNLKKRCRRYNSSDFKGIQKISLYIVTAVAIFMIYSDLKNGLYNIYDIDIFLAFKRFIKSIFRFGLVILLIRLITNSKIYKTIDLSIAVSVVFLVVTALFSEQLIDYNLMAVNANELLVTGTVKRYSGFFGWGDVNSFGGLLVIYFAYLLIGLKYAETGKIKLFLIFIVLVGIIYTGSRTALLGLAAILVLALFLEKIPVKLLYIISIVLFCLIIATIPVLKNAFLLVLQRFDYAYTSSELDIHHKGSRIAKWIMYFDYMSKYPHIYFFGTDQEYWLNMGYCLQRRVPHNVYIWMLFQSGIVPVSILLISLAKLSKMAVKNIDYWYCLLPFLCISSFVSDILGYVFYFAMMLPVIYIKKADCGNIIRN